MTGLQIHMDTSGFKNNPDVQKMFKSVEQGAATTVVAAVEKGLEGKGGKYLVDCAIAKSAEELGPERRRDGYAEWAYDEEKARKLWVESCGLVGLEDDKEEQKL